MKRFTVRFISILTCFVLLFLFSATAFAANPSESVERIDYEDGSYAIVKVVNLPAETGARSADMTSGYKDFKYYNASGTAIFDVRVTGKFTYTGTTSWATYSEATVYIYNSSASYVSKSSTYFDNVATASGTVRYQSRDVLQTVNLVCDKNGNLS